MKKLMTIGVFLLGMTSYGQLQTFVNHYSKFISDVNDVKSEVAATNVTAIFNESGKNVVVVFINGNAHRYFQTSAVEKSKTVSGVEYQLIKTVREDDGGIVLVQLFDDTLRLLSGGDYIEFFN